MARPLALAIHTAAGAAQVTDGNGEPLREVQIELTRDADSHALADLETDASGAFTIPELTPGGYHFALTKPGYIRTDLSLQWADGGLAPVLATMIRFGVVSGRATDLSGNPVSGAAVYAIANGMRTKQATIGADGRYRLYNLKPGQYRIMLTYGASSAAVIYTGETKPGPLGSGVLTYPPAVDRCALPIVGGDDVRDVDFVISPGSLYRASGVVTGTRQGGEFWIALASLDNPVSLLPSPSPMTKATSICSVSRPALTTRLSRVHPPELQPANP